MPGEEMPGGVTVFAAGQGGCQRVEVGGWEWCGGTNCLGRSHREFDWGSGNPPGFGLDPHGH